MVAEVDEEAVVDAAVSYSRSKEEEAIMKVVTMKSVRLELPSLKEETEPKLE